MSVSRDNDTILVGGGKGFETVPDAEWKAHLAHLPARFAKRLEFMTRSHRAIRELAVRELPRENERTLKADRVAATLGLPLPQVVNILDDLERNLFFLVRDSHGDIAWAFPVSAERTPHQLKFDSREWTYGACAEDAFVSPFVEGRLRGERLSAELTTCARWLTGLRRNASVGAGHCRVAAWWRYSRRKIKVVGTNQVTSLESTKHPKTKSQTNLIRTHLTEIK